MDGNVPRRRTRCWRHLFLSTSCTSLFRKQYSTDTNTPWWRQSVNGSAIIQKLKTHNILHGRGRRAGQGLARHIKVIKSPPNRKTNKPTEIKLHCHFEIPTVRPYDRVAEVLGMTARAVQTMVQRNTSSLPGTPAALPTPPVFDSFTIGAIRRHVHAKFAVNKLSQFVSSRTT
ncbi:hypothetical protein Pcinc_000675 [Petrolisthes cinctipes]|uniref:Uncharacterized protein n=1 Tax=Petrolisthes cinctipes TaxID=88211 RepID=A0AAE1GNE6_PETCI|nr:hypothetical protein Pcinc_000675 [Petrolisthes cinctipes]